LRPLRGSWDVLCGLVIYRLRFRNLIIPLSQSSDCLLRRRHSSCGVTFHSSHPSRKSSGRAIARNTKRLVTLQSARAKIINSSTALCCGGGAKTGLTIVHASSARNTTPSSTLRIKEPSVAHLPRTATANASCYPRIPTIAIYSVVLVLAAITLAGSPEPLA